MSQIIFYYVDGRMPTEKANGYQSAQMCQAFSEIGSAITLLVPYRKKTRNISGLSKAIGEYYGLRSDLKVFKLSSWDLIDFFQGRLHFSDHSYVSRFADIGSSFSAAYMLAKFLGKNQFDYLYLRSVYVLLLLNLLLPKELIKKIVFEVHNVNKNFLVRRLLCSSLNKVHAVIAVTGHLKKRYVVEGVDENKILVAHDGVDIHSFKLKISKNDAREKIGLPLDKKIASFVGKFHTNGEEKGIPEIIRASKFLFLKHPDLVIYFVGGPLERVKNYNKIIYDLELPKQKLIFIEKQPISQVPLYLAASDVLLMPHPLTEFYAYYVSPLKLFEYMASGRPIIGSNLPSICEVLTNNSNSLLVTPGCPDDLANGVSKLITDTELAEAISNQASLDVSKYSWIKRAEQISLFLENLGKV